MVPTTLDAFEDIEQFVRRHRRDGSLGDAVEEFEEPSRLLDGRRRSPFPPHLLDIFLGDQPEGSLRRKFGCDAPLTLLLHRIDAVDKLGASFIALLARVLERQLREAPKRQLPFVAEHVEAKSPKQRSGRLHDKQQSVGVGGAPDQVG